MAKSQVAAVRSLLREFLKSRGLHQIDVAEKLEVSERTVRRWFSSQPIDAETLERLCELVGVSFFELCELAAKRVDARPSQLTLAQEQLLVENGFLSYLFAQICRDWTFAELKSELAIPDPKIVEGLIQLEKGGLIDLLPSNEIRLRVNKDIVWRPHGPFIRTINRWLARVLAKPDVSEPRALWVQDTLKLSAASRARLRPKFDALHREVRELSDADRRATSQSREWFTVIMVARQIDLAPVEEW